MLSDGQLELLNSDTERELSHIFSSMTLDACGRDWRPSVPLEITPPPCESRSIAGRRAKHLLRPLWMQRRRDSADQRVRKQQTEQRCWSCITVSEDEVRRELRRVNIRKAAGPDGITGRVLRSCADQLAGLFTSIFNESLATSVIPTSFKKSVIIPVPKNSKPSCLNDYRPVALTSTVMKVFERLLKKHICSSFPATLDPLQFAYRPNRSTDDAISQGTALFPHTYWQQKWQLCQTAIHWL